VPWYATALLVSDLTRLSFYAGHALVVASVREQIANLDLWGGQAHATVASSTMAMPVLPAPHLKLAKAFKAPLQDRLDAIGFHPALSRAVFGPLPWSSEKQPCRVVDGVVDGDS
jgi:hypothetical protein